MRWGQIDRLSVVIMFKAVGSKFRCVTPELAESSKPFFWRRLLRWCQNEPRSRKGTETELEEKLVKADRAQNRYMAEDIVKKCPASANNRARWRGE